jgi:GTP cyclohydrolase I
MILEGLGLDPLQDPNFIDTPNRVAKAYVEIFSGLSDTEKQVEEILSATFPTTYSQMIVETHLTTFSMCPHHLLPVRYDVSVGYLPSEQGRVLGLSKLPRLVEVLAHRPILQEELTEQITSQLMRLKNCLGAICVIKGEHLCMHMRGVRQSHGIAITSSVKGVFMEDAAVKEEFFRLIKG